MASRPQLCTVVLEVSPRINNFAETCRLSIFVGLEAERLKWMLKGLSDVARNAGGIGAEKERLS